MAFLPVPFLAAGLAAAFFAAAALAAPFFKAAAVLAAAALAFFAAFLAFFLAFLAFLAAAFLAFFNFFAAFFFAFFTLAAAFFFCFAAFFFALLASALAFGSFLASFGVGSVCDRFLGLGCFIGSILEIRLQIVQLTRVKAILCQGVVVTPPILLDVFLRKHFLEELLLLGVKLATVCLRLRTCYSLGCPFHLGIHTLFSALQLPHRHLAGFSVRNDMCCSGFGSLGQMISMAGTNMLWARLACNW